MFKVRAIFAGGGTGGHLFPAISIADELKKLENESEILFIGTKKRIEGQIIPKTNYRFHPIWISGFQRGFHFGNLLFPIKLVVSLMQSFLIIKKFKPNVVIGTGGYVSGPVLRIASILRIPTLIQEQNSYPGVTTRLLADKVDEVHLTFESSKKYFKKTDKIFITGNPTRSYLENVDKSEALNYFGFDNKEGLKTLLIFGGSLGANSINHSVLKCINELIQNSLRIIWQTGKEDYQKVLDVTKVFTGKQIWTNKFIDRMDYAYSASDLVICRSGATTIAELTRLGKAAILVPYPYAVANHQLENSRSLADAGAAAVILDHELPSKLFPTVLSLLDGTRLEIMGQKSSKLGKPDAGRDIALRALALSKETKNNQQGKQA